MTIYSHTVLENLSTCGAMGRAQLGPRVEKAGPARQGQWWHAVARAYDEHCFKTKRYHDVEEAERIIGSMHGILSPADEAGVLAGAKAWAQNYEATWVDEATDPVFEQRFHLLVEAAELVPNERVNEITAPVFGWTCDLSWLADGVLYVRDNKSGWNISHLKEPGENLQLRRYAAAECIRRGHHGPVCLQVHHLRHDLIEEQLLDDFDPAKVWAEDIVMPVLRYERGGPALEQEYTVGPHCSYCDVKGACPAYRRFPGEFDELGPAELISAYKILGARYGEVKDKLQRLANDAPVENGEFVAAFEDSESLSFDPAKLTPLLLEYLSEDQAALAFTATKTSVDGALRKAGVKPAERKEKLKQWAEEAGEVKKSSRLYVRRSAR